MNSEDVLAKTDTPPVTMPAKEPSVVPDQPVEERLQRLEDAVAFLSHHVSWESTSPKPVTADVAGDQVSPAKPVVDPLEEPALPRAMPIPPPTASLAELSHPPFAEPASPRVSPLSNMLRPIQTALPLATSVANKVLPPSSLFRDLWWDIRIAWRMLRDPTYPMTTACKVFPLFALFYVTIWPYLSAWSGILGTVMNYFVNAIVIYIAFKVVQRELRRYYEFTQRYQQ